MTASSVAVVGAGAAGLVAAITAAAAGASVVVIERTPDGGRKILISGGGRCNILPSATAPERFVTDSPAHLMRRLLKSWPLGEQRAFFERDVGIPLALEEATGKLFPLSNRARDVRDGLVGLARRLGVRFEFGASLNRLAPADGGWTLETSQGPVTAPSVIVATGGLSVPATGSDGVGLRIADKLGHRIVPTYPALTPLVAEHAEHAPLAGLSLEVTLRARPGGRPIETRGGFLFTHRGYSGPAVLDISHVATRPASAVAGHPRSTPLAASPVPAAPSASSEAPPSASGQSGAVIRVQWSPLDAAAWTAALNASPALVASVVGRHLPARLGRQLMAEALVPEDRRATQLRRAERAALVERLTAYVLPWSGHEGYKKAEVTGGGVALDEVDPRTLESRHHRGLYLCGEMLDAFGPIGGHNFAWAWATGRLAGLGAARALR